MAENDERIEALAGTTQKILESLLASGTGLSLTQDSETKTEGIIEYDSKMRTFGLQKFESLCYIAAVNLQEDESEKDNEQPVGAVVLYLLKENAPRIIKGLGVRNFDEDDDEACAEKTGEVATMFAKSLITSKELPAYSSCFITEPIFGVNNIASGIPFNYSESIKSVVDAYLWKVHSVSVEVSLIPR